MEEDLCAGEDGKITIPMFPGSSTCQSNITLQRTGQTLYMWPLAVLKERRHRPAFMD